MQGIPEMGYQQQLRGDLKRWTPPKYSEELGRALGLMQIEGALPKRYHAGSPEWNYEYLIHAWKTAKTTGAKYQIRALFNRALTLAVSMRMQS